MKKCKLTIITTVFVFVSCSDFLYQEPDEQISIKEQFSTSEGLGQAINGMYYSIEALVSSRYFIYADLVGGNFTFTPSKNTHVLQVNKGMGIYQVYDFQDTESESDYKAFYENAYETINQANTILEQIIEIDFLSSAKKNQIKAECLVARGYIHYLLSLLYAQNYNYTHDASHLGIVYNTKTLEVGYDFPERKTMAVTYSLIKEDLDNALLLFTEKQALAYGPDYSYFNEVTARALYAKIALQMNDWEKALEYSDWTIKNTSVFLMPDSVYISEWEKAVEPVSEVIIEFSIPHDKDEEPTSSVGYDYFNYLNEKDYKNYVASEDLMNLYEAGDIRKNMFIEAWLPTSTYGEVSNRPYYFTKKFQDDPGTLYMRLTELYLIRSEAHARIGEDMQQALDDLNTIRKRAGIDNLKSADDILEEIFLERRRELAFEGNLFFDIARFKKDVSRKSGCLSKTCNLKYPSNYYVLPIPEKSIAMNENMKQNEGY